MYHGRRGNKWGKGGDNKKKGKWETGVGPTEEGERTEQRLINEEETLCE